MNAKRILVTYASQAGSTAEVAAAIGQTLSAHGFQVDVREMKTVSDLSPYQAVVAGSPIHGSRWLPEAMRFLQAQRSALSAKPFAAFLTCITLGMANAEQYRAGLRAWMAPVRDQVQPLSEGYFAGSLDFSKLPVTLNTLLLRLTTALHILPKGDHRDWDAIHAWAEGLVPLLG